MTFEAGRAGGEPGALHGRGRDAAPRPHRASSRASSPHCETPQECGPIRPSAAFLIQMQFTKAKDVFALIQDTIMLFLTLAQKLSLEPPEIRITNLYKNLKFRTYLA